MCNELLMFRLVIPIVPYDEYHGPAVQPFLSLCFLPLSFFFVFACCCSLGAFSLYFLSFLLSCHHVGSMSDLTYWRLNSCIWYHWLCCQYFLLTFLTFKSWVFLRSFLAAFKVLSVTISGYNRWKKCSKQLTDIKSYSHTPCLQNPSPFIFSSYLYGLLAEALWTIWALFLHSLSSLCYQWNTGWISEFIIRQSCWTSA